MDNDCENDLQQEYYSQLIEDIRGKERLPNSLYPCGDYHREEEWDDYVKMRDEENKKRDQSWEESVYIPEEFDHFHQVLINAAQSGKYPANNWLEPNGYNTDKKSMYGSIFRHCAEAYHGVIIDKDSGLDPRLHAAVRLMMDYTRSLRGIKNSSDEEGI